MKKVITLLLSLMLLLNPLEVMAASETQEVKAGTHSCSVTLPLLSSDISNYVVTVPKNLVLDTDTFSTQYSVSVSGEIEDNYTVAVIPDSTFNMKSGDKIINATVTQSKTEWSKTDVEKEVEATGVVQAADAIKLDWQGEFNFNIELKDLTDDSNISQDIELVDGQVVNGGQVELGAGQSGSVRLTTGGVDVTHLAKYSSSNPNISVNKGIIDTSLASAGDTATITATYTPTQSTSMYSVRAISEDVLTATFEVKVVGIRFSEQAVTISKGDSAEIEVNLLPDSEAEITVDIVGLDFTKEGNKVTIKTDSNTVAGNYSLVARYNTYSEILSIKVVESGSSHTHDWETEFTIDTPAGCETEGSKSIHCTGCDEVKDTTTIAANGHSYTDGKCTGCGQDEPIQYNVVTLRSTAGENDYAAGFMNSKSKNSSYYRSEIESVTFYDDSSKASGHYVTDANCWDVSNAGDGSILAWVDLSTTINGYDIHIAPTVENAKIMAHSNIDNMFAHIDDIKIKGLEYIDFSNVTSADYFAYETALSSFEFPSTLKVVGKSAFENSSYDDDEGPVTLIIPEGVTKIGDKAFYYCGGTKSIVLPDSLTEIGSSAFYNCTGITELEIPDGVTKINEDAFAYCKGLTTINLPSSLKYLGDSAFSNCSSVTNITNTENLSSLEYINYGSLTKTPWFNQYKQDDEDGIIIFGKVLLDATLASGEVTIPEGTLMVADRAFYGNTNVTKINIPDSITSLGSCAFYGCTQIKEIDIPDNITEIDTQMFKGCTALETVHFPDNVCAVSSDVLTGTALYDSIVANAVDGTLIADGKVLLGMTGATGDIVIPEGVTCIAHNAFKGNTNITSIKLPESLLGISSDAFSKCSGLKQLTIPNNVKYIGTTIIYKCSAMTKVTFNDNTNWTACSDYYGTVEDINSNEISSTALTLLNNTYSDKVWRKK